MGYPPPPNAPPPAVQALANAGGTFSVGATLPVLPSFPGGNLGLGVSTPTIPFSLCGFKIPVVGVGVSFNVPPFKLPIPAFFASIGIDCLGIKNAHPLNFAAGVGWGGGRNGFLPPDPDDAE